jgi:hypothetical protein
VWDNYLIVKAIREEMLDQVPSPEQAALWRMYEAAERALKQPGATHNEHHLQFFASQAAAVFGLPADSRLIQDYTEVVAAAISEGLSY